MSGVKPKLRPRVTGANVTNLYISQCSVCRMGIFADPDRPYHWSRRPLGLVHTDCVEVPS